MEFFVVVYSCAAPSILIVVTYVIIVITYSVASIPDPVVLDHFMDKSFNQNTSNFSASFY